MSTTAPRSVLRPFALLLSLLLAITGLTLPAVAAHAAQGDVAGATLQWGVKESFRNYITGSIAHGQWIATGVSDATPFGWSGGIGAAPDGTGTVAYPGSLQFQGHQSFGVPEGEYALDLTFSDVKVRITGAATAELVLDARSRGFSDPTTFVELNDVVFATLDLSAGTNGSTDALVAYSGVPATLTADGATAFAGNYPAGTALDPVSFSWPVEAAPLTATGTTLSVTPGGGAVVGDEVTLVATVAPAVAGSVRFHDGEVTLGEVAVTDGVAELVTDELVVGDHELRAVFTPESGDYAGSSSESRAYEVVAVVPTRGAAWGISTYLNSANFGRPNPAAAYYTAPATFDAATRTTTWGAPTVVANADGTVTLSFSGASLNHAATGGNWMRLADLEATLDPAGNGVVSAVVSYGTVPGTPGSIPFNPDTAVTVRGPERVDIVTLASNEVAPIAVPGGATWSGLGGTWNEEFVGFLAGGNGAAAWGYASTVTNTGAADRLPSAFTFTLPELPTFVSYETDLQWGLSGYLNSANFGRPNPAPSHYGSPATFDSASRLTTFTSGTVVANDNRTITVSYPGSSLNHAATGGNWLRISEPQVTVDESGNGSVTALVSYGTVPGTPGSIPFDASTAQTVRGPERITVMKLTGNDAELSVIPAGASLAGLGGAWDDEFLGFLAGDATAAPAIPAWGYASTVTNTGADDRRPAPLTLRFAEAPVFSGTPDGEEPEGPGEEEPEAPAPTPAPGTLVWGVKSSFRDYIVGSIARGTIATSGGAGTRGSAFWFPQSGVSLSEAGIGSVAYRGTVAFSGHSGVLSVRVGDPVVRITSATSGVLSVVTASGRVDFATLDLDAGTRSVAADGAITYSGVPATLTSAGATGFAGYYSAGESLDPVSFTIGSNNSASGQASSRGAGPIAANTPDETPPATEGIESEQSEFTAGGPATFTATGYQPGEEGILAVIYSEPTLLADDLVADADGAVTWTGTLPIGLTGEHTFTFQGSVDRGIVIDIAAAEVVGCPVDTAGLDWGFKESFRAYIDGSIANGEWTTADGATYATPLFSWANGSGGYDAGSGDADLAFTGSVTFTGHGGVLNTTIANPRIVIDGERAVLLLDVWGTTQAGEAISSQGVEFVSLDLAAGEVGGGGDLVAFSGIPAVLTDAGAAAFGTYEAGTEFDPVDLRINVDPACVTAASTDEEPTGVEPEPVADASPLPWVLGGAALLALIAVVAFLLLRRNRTA